MRKAVLSAAMAAIFAASSAGAQSVTLTESDALARLAADNPRVRALRAGVDIARADVLAAVRWPNPRVNWDRQSVAGVTEHYVTVSQPLPITGRRRFEMQTASALVSASDRRADGEVRRLRADLRLAFSELVAAQARERELAAARDRLRELSAVLARREGEGDAAGFDRLRAERDVLDVESDLVIAATERARAQGTLAGFFAERIDPASIVAAPPAAAAAPVPALDALLERAESSRGELAAYGHEIEAARFAARAAERSLLPEPEIFLGTKSSTASSGGTGSAVTIGDKAVGPVIGVHTAIPLFDRARPERALAAARAARAEAAAASFRVVLRGEVAALRDAVLQRRAAAGRYRAESVQSAMEIERIAQVSYDAGERSILELLDAYGLGASARVRQTTLDLAVREAEIELEFATGWEMP